MDIHVLWFGKFEFCEDASCNCRNILRFSDMNAYQKLKLIVKYKKATSPYKMVKEGDWSLQSFVYDGKRKYFVVYYKPDDPHSLEDVIKYFTRIFRPNLEFLCDSPEEAVKKCFPEIPSENEMKMWLAIAGEEEK